MHRFTLVALGTVIAARVTTAAIVGPSDYIVGSIPLPGIAQGDVAVIGTSIVVGQGSFGGGAESIIRRDADGTTTTIATGFNSLSGFAVSPHGDLLFVTDNGGEQAGATTGDTVFAIASPGTATAAVAAAGRETAAVGSIPFAQGITVGPDGEVYVTNAAGGSAGTVLRHRSFLFPPFVTQASGFGFTAGLAFGTNGHLFVGDVNATTFVGRVVELDPSGAMVGTLASGLSGAFDQAFDRDGNLLVTGGFTGDFSSSTIVSIDSSGVVSEFAHGFAFSTGLEVDSISGRVYVTDSGSSALTTFTPVSALAPGGGSSAIDCLAEFSDAPVTVSRSGLPTTLSVCRDGSACDRDRLANGVCTFGVGVCFNVSSSSLCVPAGVESFAALPGGGVIDAQVAALASAAQDMLPAAAPVCVGPLPVTVATRVTARGPRPGVKTVRTLATHTTGSGRVQNDRDSLILRCLP